MRHLYPAPFKAAVILATALLCDPAQAGVRAFVSSTGSDANTATSCSPTTPCRSFTSAMSVVDQGGEIVALDAAGYGAVTVTKSVTITANPGFYAGVAASSGAAVTIATANITVVLRGLNITNTDAADYGINMTSGSKLVIENCVISKFGQYGVRVTSTAQVRIADSSISENNNGVFLSNGSFATVTGSRFSGSDSGDGGLIVDGSVAGKTTRAAVSDSVFSGNFSGVLVCATDGSSKLSMTRSTLVNNGYGVIANGCGGSEAVTVSNNLITGNVIAGLSNNGGTFLSLGNNTGSQNEAETSGTITTVTGF